VNFAATDIVPGNRMLLAGEDAKFVCSSPNAPLYWHFYSVVSHSKPCGFNSADFHPGISLCASHRRISVTNSSLSKNVTYLVINGAQLSDAGSYTCGGHNPYNRSTTASVIIGIFGKHTIWLYCGWTKRNVYWQYAVRKFAPVRHIL